MDAKKFEAPAVANDEGREVNPYSTTVTGHVERVTRSNGDSYAGWDETTYPRDTHVQMKIIVTHDDYMALYCGEATSVEVCRDCIDTGLDEARERRRKEREAAAAKQREEKNRREELELIFDMTGEHLSAYDLPLRLAEDYRQGRDITRWVKTITALEDLALQHAELKVRGGGVND